MQALQYAEYGGPEVLRLVDVPLVEPGPGQVRVAVRAAGVNPRDAKLRGGRFASEPLAHPAGPGMELSGVVDAVGDGVDVWRVGQPVFGRSVTRDAVATHALAPADDLVAKPDRLTHAQAAALPIAVETAYRGLRQLGPGATLLIHGASGGVGLVATQLALIEGLTVVGTVSDANRAAYRKLGPGPRSARPRLPSASAEADRRSPPSSRRGGRDLPRPGRSPLDGPRRP
ncbi:NADP-dependent oxidoreductase [Streptomyces prunicolor]|uniref:NADP-dependent oxidoreductase n=1 Tax=Streptomyces prunicolor TaxID=67348 RepID=UPI00341FF6C9